MNETQAGDVLQKTREWFKAGFKATNKAKVVSGTEILTPESEARAMNASKAAIFNLPTEEFASELMKARETLAQKNIKGFDTLATGHMIVKMGVRAGNCADYAAVALYYADTLYNERGYSVRLEKGDHVFAVFPPKSAYLQNIHWQNVEAAFSVVKAKGETWIVDGWANIACQPANYSHLFKEQLGAWAKVSKRILWKPYGSPKDATGSWTHPKDDRYLQEFAGSPLAWKR